MRKHSLGALLVAVGAALMLGAASARADDAPGLTMSFSTAPLMLVDGNSVVLETTVTCDASYAATMVDGGMYLWVAQGPVDNPTGAAHGDAGPLVCDGLPHTYTSVASPDLADPALQLRPGRARLSGSIYIWYRTDTGGYDVTGAGPFEAETTVVGSPMPKPTLPAPPATEFGFQFGHATIDPGGGVTVTVTATCPNETYAGDYLGSSVTLTQDTVNGLATGRSDNWQLLTCDGASHSYSLGTVRPSSPAHPFRAGRAIASAWLYVVTADWNWVMDTPYSSSIDIRGAAPPPASATPGIELNLEAAVDRLEPGAVTAVLKATCDESYPYAGGLIGVYAGLTQRNPAGIATAPAWAGYDGSPLVCDGTAHAYAFTPFYPDDWAVPFQAGPATVWASIWLTSPEGDYLGDIQYSAKIAIRG